MDLADEFIRGSDFGSDPKVLLSATKQRQQLEEIKGNISPAEYGQAL